MEQKDYLEFSEDGKTVISCRKDHEGAVVIPESETEIEDSAFYHCNSLTEVHLQHKTPVDFSNAF